MAIRLNHTNVAARDKQTAAKFLTDILGLPAPSLVGPFAVVQASEDTSLDYMDTDGEIRSQHYAYLANSTDPEPGSIVHRVVDRCMLTPLLMQRGAQSLVESRVSITLRRMTAPSLLSRPKVNLHGIPAFASTSRKKMN